MLHFFSEGLIPLRTGTTCGGKEEATGLDIFLEVFPFFGGEGEVALSRHDDKGEMEELVIIQTNGAETATSDNAGFLLNGRQKLIAEATRGLVAGIDKVATLDDPFFRFSGKDYEASEKEGKNVLEHNVRKKGGEVKVD